MNRLLVILLGSLLTSTTSAHHGVSDDIDLENPKEIKGDVTNIEWINPHVVIHLEIQSDNGRPQLWLIQVDSPNTLLRRGVNRNIFRFMGDINIAVFPFLTNNCNPVCYAIGLSFTDPRGYEYILSQEMLDKTTELQIGQ